MLHFAIGMLFAASSAVWSRNGTPEVLDRALAAPVPAQADAKAARFARCDSHYRATCIIDGDTFRYRGETIRIADINTPELSDPQCAREARLAEHAAQRLAMLLNAGPFALVSVDRDTDRYGRRLRIVTRRGASLGEMLVLEGLAERWHGHRRNWC